MIVRHPIQFFLCVDVVLGILLVLILITSLVDLRDYDDVPAASQEWQEMVQGLDELAGGRSQSSIVNKRVLSTMRSAAPVRKLTGGIGDYSLAGQGSGKAYFLHNKTGAIAIRSVGEELEGYIIRKIDENSVEFEKDEKTEILLF